VDQLEALAAGLEEPIDEWRGVDAIPASFRQPASRQTFLARMVVVQVNMLDA
jgi:hypothetical protein